MSGPFTNEDVVRLQADALKEVGADVYVNADGLLACRVDTDPWDIFRAAQLARVSCGFEPWADAAEWAAYQIDLDPGRASELIRIGMLPEGWQP